MRFFKRSLSFLLAVVFLLVFAPIAEAKTGTLAANSGTRHVVCTALSSQAQAYYTGNYTYASVSALSASASAPMSSAMFSRLSTLMSSTMTKTVSYSSLTSYWPKTDANNGSSNPILFYSDELSSSFNREHVWPKSRGSFYQSNAGSDLHHLRPTNANVNSTRGNMTMGNVKGVLSTYKTYAYDGKTVLWYSSDADLVEVNDNIKGDVARILLYVWCRWQEPNLYENDPSPVIGSGDDANNGLKVIESLDTLLEWMENDPVDTWEMSRNDQCENVQGNRNVFIDYPEYAWLLFERTPPADYQTPSGEAAQYETFAITAAANNDAWGSVSVTGRTVTATPNAGYYVKDATVSPEGAALLTRSGNSFRVTNLTADCTVTVEFAVKTPVTVTFMDEIGLNATTVSTYAGDAFLLPVGTNATVGGTEYVFFGWADAGIADTTDIPTVFTGGSQHSVTKDTTLYAVYRYSVAGGTENEWTQVTNAAALADGGEYAFVGVPFDSSRESGLVMNNTPIKDGFWSYDALENVTGSFESGTAAVNTVPENAVWRAKLLSQDAFAFTNAAGQEVLALQTSTNSSYKRFNVSATQASLSDTSTCWRIRDVSSNYRIKLSTDLYSGFFLSLAYGYDDFAAYSSDNAEAAAIAACYMLMRTGGKTYHYTSTNSDTPTPTVKPTATPTSTPTVKPTATPTATPAVKPTATPTATPTVKPTATPTPVPTAVTLPTDGEYVLRIEGGNAAEHMETVNGAECLRVDVYLDGETSEWPLSSVEFNLLYDADRLTFVKYTVPSSATPAANAKEPGIFRFACGFTTPQSNIQTILTLYFTVVDGLENGTLFEFSLTGAVKAYSWTYNTEKEKYESQKRTVGAVLKPFYIYAFYGDANCDGRVTASDAAMILRKLAGKSTLSAQGGINALVSGSSKLSAQDAALILRRVVGLIDRFPAEP